MSETNKNENDKKTTKVVLQFLCVAFIFTAFFAAMYMYRSPKSNLDFLRATSIGIPLSVGLIIILRYVFPLKVPKKD